MEIELVEIRDFLAQRPPFDVLPEEQLNQLPKILDIRYLRRGSDFPPPESDQSYIYILRSGAVELLDEEDKLVEKLGEGGVYTTDCQLIDFGRAIRGISTEDTLLYQLPCSHLKVLRQSEPAFDRHFSESIRDRLKQAVRTLQDNGENSSLAQMTVEVSHLLKKAPITIGTNSTIRQAAQLMSEKNVSSVMLMSGDRLAGMITDRDLRKRCVAAGLSPEEPVSAIMTTDLETVQENTLAIQALMTMTRLHVHHLPVMRDAQVVGMLSATDLARHQTTNSAFLATDVRKAETLQDLANVSARLPELQFQLANSSATALHIGEAISSITDSLTVRLIEMAEAELGPAPVPYVWMCGGSQARGEQTSHSDQDNALLISDQMKPEHVAYFETLAKRVTDGLNACNFVYCPGDAMASNDKWRQTLSAWRKYFNTWINKPDPMSLMLSSIFFDLRPVHGDKELFLELQSEILDKTRGNGIFTAFMAANALQHRPPLGFFRTFVLIHDGAHDDTFDIKHRGIVPITDIARVFALSQGLKPVNTTERLLAAAETSILSREMGENLVDALEFIASMRINHQAEQIRKGIQPDNYLAPDELSDLERRHLKDAFRVIQDMQETLESRYQGGRFR
ncbi:MAG: CBS domain-containing protein [Candidatus Thiodiazotropha sp. (ex Semelilucina semeliformis)]|nr:CBS domain-containing protein [Candidatus Thiodiazotropha sp. (ex Myrtea spinifera)]MCU7807477.1 CBS domain-containing protein [Candidatus Thiodiazotropha sp. (ex Semelilucina semeliformis)]MCU7830386.1 CBS domain-containing protein [Candidatus Thiodiazotropha sp. (ex Myrtea sp. 'scaly one' KF741663)]